MGTFSGQRIRDVWGSVLHVDTGNAAIDGTLVRVEDGRGTDTCLQLSTTAAQIDGDLAITGTLSGATVQNALANGSTVTATTGTTSRTLASHFNDVLTSADFGCVGDGVTNDTTALQAAMTACATANRPLRLLPGTYKITAQLTCPSNLTMFHDGHPDACVLDFAYSGSAQDMMKITSRTNVWLEGFTMNAHQSGTLVNGNCLDITGSTDVALRRLQLLNAPDEGLYISGGSDISFVDGVVTGAQASGIILTGSAQRITIEGVDLTANTMFGIFGHDADYLYLRHNRCTSSGLELIGIRYTCSYGEITGNFATATGDNGISITGSHFTVANNICHTNHNSGIWVYGEHNTVTGNVCYNNGQNGGGGGNYAGIRVSPAFGGASRNNTVTGNVCFDTQSPATQKWGLQLGSGSSYTLSWTTATVYAAADYVKHLNNLYLTTAGGTSGASAPVHTSGTVSDGGVSWTYVFTTDSSFHATGNTITGNQCHGNLTADFQNDATSGINVNTTVGTATIQTNINTNTDVLSLVNSTTTSNAGANIRFGISTTTTTESAKIRAIRTNSPVGGATYLDFLTHDGSALARRLRIREQGAVEVSVKLNLATLTAEPYTPTDGDLAYADGTTWNPGGGAGFYGRVSGAWVKL